MAKKEVFGNPGDSENVDIKQLLASYFKYWYLFIISFIICLGLAFVYVYMATPQYRVISTILLKNEESQSNSKGSELGELNLFNTKQSIDNELEVLSSKSLMQRTFQELSLAVTYHVEEKFKTKEIYGKELPIRLSITKLHQTAFGHTIIIRRKTSTMNSIQEEGGKISNHTYGEEVSMNYGIFTVIAA